MTCLPCQLAMARRENARLRGELPSELPPSHCPEHGPEYRALVERVNSARLVHAALSGQEQAEALRAEQSRLYRSLRRSAVDAAHATPEAAFARSYGALPRVVMPLRDPSSRGMTGLSKSPTYVLPAPGGPLTPAVSEGQARAWLSAAETAESWADKAERLEAVLDPVLAQAAVQKLAYSERPESAPKRTSTSGVSTARLRRELGRGQHVCTPSKVGVCTQCGGKLRRVG